jgi:hypothetical protein
MQKTKIFIDKLLIFIGYVSFNIGTYIYLIQGDVATATYYVVVSCALFLMSKI